MALLAHILVGIVFTSSRPWTELELPSACAPDFDKVDVCKLYIELHAQDFPNNKTKGFLDHLSMAFTNPQQAAAANQKIRALKQGKNSVAHYSMEFKLLAQDLTWNEAALMDQYIEGLANDVLDELA
ncbi:UNVERIFIED_CONTAM: hypothetical protein K2H54_055724 [Gekko kuhli]